MYDKLSVPEIILLTLKENGGKVYIDELQEKFNEIYSKKCKNVESCEEIKGDEKEFIANSLYYLTTVKLVILERDKIDSEKINEIINKYKKYFIGEIHIHTEYGTHYFDKIPLYSFTLQEKFSRKDIKNLIRFLQFISQIEPQNENIIKDIEKLKNLMRSKIIVKLTKEREEIASKLID